MAIPAQSGRVFVRAAWVGVAFALVVLAGGAGEARAAQAAKAATSAPAGPASAVAVPAEYQIGADDVLTIVFWREPDLGGEVVVVKNWVAVATPLSAKESPRGKANFVSPWEVFFQRI